jgi:hypothetical protein
MRRTPLSIVLFAVATILVALGLLSLAFRSHSTLFENPLTEDGYYVLSVARQIALGHGITIDGQQLTNGFQPLFAFLLVPIYAAFGDDRYSSLRGVLAVHWAAHVTTAVLLGLIVKTSLRSQGTERSTIGFWATAFLWLASRYVLLNSYNGLETGCTLLLYALAWRLYQLNWLDGWKLIGLSSVLGLLILARIDAVIFVATLATFELFRWDMPLQLRFRRAVAITLISFIISLPWWLYNLFFFGSLMPSSGTAQAAPFSFARVAPMLSSALQVLAPYIQIRWIEGLPQMLLQACIVLIIALLFAKTAFSDMKTTNAFRIGGVITISTAILGLYYLLFSGAPHFYGRYLSPFMLISIVVAAITLAQVDRFHNLIRFAVLIPLVLIAAASILGYQFQVGVSKSPFYNDQLQLIEASVPHAETVSAGQSGTIGYFRDHVVNLDGKVNAEALHYRNNMWKYLENRNIAWYCDWSSGFLGPDPAANGWTVVGRRGSFLLYHHSKGGLREGFALP